MRYRLRTLLILMLIGQIALAALSVNFLTLPLRESDKAAAARVLVAWIVEGRPVPGFGEPYPDAKWMLSKKRFFVVCDDLPSSATVSSDSRVQKVDQSESNELFKQFRFDETDYITIERKTDSKYVLVLEFSNQLGDLGGHGYRFEFRRKLWGLRARGKFLWVS